jgi:hypothetical protein
MTASVIRTPDDLALWAASHEPSDNMLGKPAYWHQVMFMRNQVRSLFFPIEENIHPVRVVGTHRSKSVELPVYSLAVPGLVEVRLRNNFYDWKISVKASHRLPDLFMGLFDTLTAPSAIYCQGFSADWIFGPYAQNPSQFSLEIFDDYKVYTLLYILSRTLGLPVQRSKT